MFCLPFAGGNKYSYQKYQVKAPDFLKFVALEYPGRGARAGEPLVTDSNVLLADLYNKIRPYLDQDLMYAVYGHSMGGLMAYLLTRRIIERGYTAPLHVFVTGAMGPAAVSREEKMRHLLSKQEFIQEIKNLNGSPREILENEELLNYFEPILRADFKAIETYVHEAHVPVNIPFTVISGTEEDMKKEDIQAWQEESSYPIDFVVMPGGHFFIFDHVNSIMNTMVNKLSIHVKGQ